MSVGAHPRLAVAHAGAGEAVLFLHGIGGHRANWAPQLPAVAERFHAIAPDMRGYGDSEDGPLDFDLLADDIGTILDAFGVTRGHLVGLSFGGWVALAFARRHPDRLASLVLCGTQPGPGRSSDADRAAFVRARLGPLDGSKSLEERARAGAAAMAGRRAPAAVIGSLAASMGALRRESYLKAVEAASTFDSATAAAAVRMPTLMLAGEDDRLSTVTAVRALCDAIPNAELAVLPETGHLMNIENPGAFNAVVTGFLGRVAARAAAA
jgi:3-oxoadipate enol-lactonase